MTRQRLLMFGIDAATLDLVRPWVARGELPALGRLIEGGVVGPLRSVPNMITPAAWTSFATGCNPAKHGIFYFTERIPGTYDERFIKGASRAIPPFWMLLSRSGVTCTVVNVPMTFPADPVSGVMVSGMDAPGVDTPGYTHPPGLAADLKRRFTNRLGSDSGPGGIGHLMLAGSLDAALDALTEKVRARTDLARYLIEQYPSDLFALVHTEVDDVQHYFWAYMDPRVPGPTRAQRMRYADSILRLYREVDRSLEALQDAFGPSLVLVLSDHGAGASPGVEDGLPWIHLVLEELGLSAHQTDRGLLHRTSRRTAVALYRSLNPRLPHPVRRLLRRWTPTALNTVKATMQYHLDWARTRAFCRGAAGDLWINVRGREPEGIVEPGAEYDRIRALIREEFLALREASSGEPIVEVVQYREEVYEGPFVDRAPDLLIRFRDLVLSGVVMRGKVLRLPRQAAARPKDVKSGSHRPEGLLIMGGPGVRGRVDLAGAALVDIAPTTLFVMGHPVPSYMDGRILTEAFTPECLAASRVEEMTLTPDGGGPREMDYTDEESAVLTERLRGLGYI